MAGQFATLKRTRNIALALVPTLIAADCAATALAVLGEMGGAWHRLILSWTDRLWFAVIAIVCTVIAVEAVRMCGLAISRRFDAADETAAQRADQQDEQLSQHTTQAVTAAVDAMHLAQLSTGMRRQGNNS